MEIYDSRSLTLNNTLSNLSQEANVDFPRVCLRRGWPEKIGVCQYLFDVIVHTIAVRKSLNFIEIFSALMMCSVF